MKKTLVLLTFCGSALLLFQNNRNGALPQNTGAPGDLTCGRAPCHNVTPNIGDAEIAVDFDMGDTTYMPETSYTVTVSISNTTRVRQGFQLLALDEENNNVGTWELTDAAIMQIIDGIADPTRKYVTHRAAGTEQKEWSLNWIAPEEAAGKVTFYASVNDANNNGANTGDDIYTTSTSVEAATISSVSPILEADAISVFPNPARERIFVRSENYQIEIILLFDKTGKLLRQTNQTEMQVADLPTGIYIVKAVTEAGVAIQKLLVQQ